MAILITNVTFDLAHIFLLPGMLFLSLIVVRKLERKKAFLLLIITCDIFEFLSSFLCSSFILVSSSNYQKQSTKIKYTRSRHFARDKTPL